MRRSVLLILILAALLYTGLVFFAFGYYGLVPTVVGIAVFAAFVCGFFMAPIIRKIAGFRSVMRARRKLRRASQT